MSAEIVVNAAIAEYRHEIGFEDRIEVVGTKISCILTYPSEILPNSGLDHKLLAVFCYIYRPEGNNVYPSLGSNGLITTE